MAIHGPHERALPVVERDAGDAIERLGFLSSSSPGLFCRMLLPERPTGGVLICPDLSAARSRSLERERSLITEVARRGLAALVFDYHGEARSTSAAPPGLAAVTRDVRDALAVLEGEGEHGSTAVLGIGAGGLIAAAALTVRQVSLATWDTPENGERWLTALVRVRAIGQMGFDARGDTSLLDRVTTDLLGDELARGTVSVLGFDLPATLATEIAALSRPDTDSFDGTDPMELVAGWACSSGENA